MGKASGIGVAVSLLSASLNVCTTCFAASSRDIACDDDHAASHSTSTSSSRDARRARSPLRCRSRSAAPATGGPSGLFAPACFRRVATQSDFMVAQGRGSKERRTADAIATAEQAKSKPAALTSLIETAGSVTECVVMSFESAEGTFAAVVGRLHSFSRQPTCLHAVAKVTRDSGRDVSTCRCGSVQPICSRLPSSEAEVRELRLVLGNVGGRRLCELRLDIRRIEAHWRLLVRYDILLLREP